MIIHLDAVASLAGFAGGAILAHDALRIRRVIGARRGADRLVEETRAISGEPLRAPDGAVLKTPKDVEDWFARQTMKYAWLGFLFLAAGFLIDLITKMGWNPIVS